MLKKNQNLPRILKVSENRKSCRKVAKQLVAKPNFKSWFSLATEWRSEMEPSLRNL